MRTLSPDYIYLVEEGLDYSASSSPTLAPEETRRRRKDVLIPQSRETKRFHVICQLIVMRWVDERMRNGMCLAGERFVDEKIWYAEEEPPPRRRRRRSREARRGINSKCDARDRDTTSQHMGRDLSKNKNRMLVKMIIVELAYKLPFHKSRELILIHFVSLNDCENSNNFPLPLGSRMKERPEVVPQRYSHNNNNKRIIISN